MSTAQGHLVAFHKFKSYTSSSLTQVQVLLKSYTSSSLIQVHKKHLTITYTTTKNFFFFFLNQSTHSFSGITLVYNSNKAGTCWYR